MVDSQLNPCIDPFNHGYTVIQCIGVSVLVTSMNMRVSKYSSFLQPKYSYCLIVARTEQSHQEFSFRQQADDMPICRLSWSLMPVVSISLSSSSDRTTYGALDQQNIRDNLKQPTDDGTSTQ